MPVEEATSGPMGVTHRGQRGQPALVALTIGLGIVAGFLGLTRSPRFFVGSQALSATKVVVDAPMNLVSATTIAFAVALAVTSVVAIGRFDGKRGSAHLLWIAAAFLVGLGLVAAASMQHLAVMVAEDDRLFGLGPRGVRSAVLLISDVRSAVTWAVAVLLVAWLAILARLVGGSRWSSVERIGLAVAGLTGLLVAREPAASIG